eukprot:8666707-Karenia_brevis.AAC.1
MQNGNDSAGATVAPLPLGPKENKLQQMASVRKRQWPSWGLKHARPTQKSVTSSIMTRQLM